MSKIYNPDYHQQYYKDNVVKIKERQAKYYATPEGKDRAKFAAWKSSIKKKFNLTLEQWNEMFNAQNGCCKICGKHQSELKIRLAVDHNHETGKIRGLLCDGCNRGIGYFQESQEALVKAADYLKDNE